METKSSTQVLLEQVRALKPLLPTLTTQQKREALHAMADSLLAQSAQIMAANSLDVQAAMGTISLVMLDRLALTPARVAEMAAGMRAVAALDDPVGQTLQEHGLENGLEIQRVSVPLGVIAIIYESRPNVTSDAASLAFYAGSACVLRGGKESYRSNAAIVKALQAGLAQQGLPAELISLVQDTSRESARELMTAQGFVDLLIPRGGASLIATCVAEATVPCIETGTGICHIYVDESADMDMALAIIENAKTSRPSVCNAAEVLLVHETIAEDLLPLVREALVTKRLLTGETPVELRLEAGAAAFISGTAAGDADFDTEFLDYILAVRLVPDVRAAIAHINAHSTGHSEAIVTETEENAALFSQLVDSAAVYVNASTRFTDGGQFGLGCEMGISTQKLHARGPMGLRELCSYKYVIRGNGQIR